MQGSLVQEGDLRVPRNNHLLCVSQDGLEFLQETRESELKTRYPVPKKLPTVSEEESKGFQESSSRKGMGYRQRFNGNMHNSQSATTLGPLNSPESKENLSPMMFIRGSRSRVPKRVFLENLGKIESIDGSISKLNSTSPNKVQTTTPRSNSTAHLIATAQGMGSLGHLVGSMSPNKSRLKAILKTSQEKNHSKSDVNLTVLKSHIEHTLSPDEDSEYIKKKATTYLDWVGEEERQLKLKRRIHGVAHSPKPTAKDLALQTTMLVQVKKSPLSKDCVRELMVLQQLKRIKNRCKEYDQEYHTINSHIEEVWNKKTKAKSKPGTVFQELNKICANIEEINDKIDPVHRFPSYEVQKSIYELPRLPSTEWKNPIQHFRSRSIEMRSVNRSSRNSDIPTPFEKEDFIGQSTSLNQSELMQSWIRLQQEKTLDAVSNQEKGVPRQASPVRLFRQQPALESTNISAIVEKTGGPRPPKLAGFGHNNKMVVPRRLRHLGSPAKPYRSAQEETYPNSLFTGSASLDDRLPTIRESSRN